MDETDLRDDAHGSGTASARARGSVSGAVDLGSALIAAKAGDESGFAFLWRALHPAVLRYLTVCGDGSPDDVAAETWLHVVRGLADFEGGVADFRAWLFTVARRRAIDAGRLRARRPEHPVAEPAEHAAGATSPSAETVADEHESTRRALALVATLPPLQAEMVMLRVVAGLEVADVARLVERKPGAVRVAVHRALRSLARDFPEASPHLEGGVPHE